MADQLEGRFIRLEPLAERHASLLANAAAESRRLDPALFELTVVPQNEPAALAYIRTALAWQAAGTALPFAIARRSDGAIVGSTRIFDLETWSWPIGHPRHGRSMPDVCEVGYTWLGAQAIRTAINTEAKLLLLSHAFETWGTLRVCLKTDSRNIRSRAAIERIGGRFEGIWRAHQLATDFTVRDTARYSITAEEWPAVRDRLQARLLRA